MQSDKTSLPIGVKEARKLLGRKYGHLNDDQIGEIILVLTLIARDYLENLGSKK